MINRQNQASLRGSPGKSASKTYAFCNISSASPNVVAHLHIVVRQDANKVMITYQYHDQKFDIYAGIEV